MKRPLETTLLALALAAGALCFALFMAQPGPVVAPEPATLWELGPVHLSTGGLP